jgi:hypothetical protein
MTGILKWEVFQKFFEREIKRCKACDGLQIKLTSLPLLADIETEGK